MDIFCLSHNVDLAALTTNYTALDGQVLSGTPDGSRKISIADGVTVTLSDVAINGDNNSSRWYAGVTCDGDATIILSGTNTVRGYYENLPGILVPENKTLTIQGSGSLTASSNGFGAGIGGKYCTACGNIVIKGGSITATGGSYSAGIGGSRDASCGYITISGGTITSTGGSGATGIGSGSDEATCGDITITNTVTKVTAKKGTYANYSIGTESGSCTVTIGGNVGYITDSPYTYQP